MFEFLQFLWDVFTFRYPDMPWWMTLVVGFVWAWGLFHFVGMVLSVLDRVERARHQHEWDATPLAYYEEHRGVYAVFLPSDMHRAFSQSEDERYKGYMFAVKPTLTFVPDSAWCYPPMHTGRIMDMVLFFQGWRLERPNVSGAYFLVPCAARDDNREEQLQKCPLVTMNEARKILRAERERCEKAAISTWWYFWHW